MARLKSVDLRICFSTKYSNTPVGVKYNYQQTTLDKGQTFIDLPVESIDQVVDIEFFGFVPDDKMQVIKVEIYYKDKKVDTISLCKFHMKNNRFVENTVLENYNEIFFNGNLKIKFFKQWFECNLLSGAYITNQKRFLHRWVLDYGKQNNLRSAEGQEYDIYCIGCSFTFGIGLETQDTWPELLSKKLDCSVGNYGVPGMSVHGCFRQVLYCLENLDVKKIIVLLPPFERMFYKFKFLGNNAYYNYTPMGTENSFSFLDEKTNVNKILKHSKRLGKRIIQKLVTMNKNNRNIYITSWFKSVYDCIPEGDHKLPIFPKLDTFRERASDNQHPHRKHYELFVKSIKPYVDKKQKYLNY